MPRALPPLLRARSEALSLKVLLEGFVLHGYVPANAVARVELVVLRVTALQDVGFGEAQPGIAVEVELAVISSEDGVEARRPALAEFAVEDHDRLLLHELTGVAEEKVQQLFGRAQVNGALDVAALELVVKSAVNNDDSAGAPCILAFLSK